MNPILFGIIAGVIFGVADVALMIPMPHPNKGTAMRGASAVASPSVPIMATGAIGGAIIGALAPK